MNTPEGWLWVNCLHKTLECDNVTNLPGSSMHYHTTHLYMTTQVVSNICILGLKCVNLCIDSQLEKKSYTKYTLYPILTTPSPYSKSVTTVSIASCTDYHDDTLCTWPASTYCNTLWIDDTLWGEMWWIEVVSENKEFSSGAATGTLTSLSSANKVIYMKCMHNDISGISVE